jgi:glycosyltransferase involved in cell wall biosynthesis
MGGMEEHILHLARGLAARGRRVALVCSPNEEIEPLRRPAAEAGAQVFEVGSGGGLSATIWRLLALWRTFKSFKFGILHIHMTGPHGGELAMLAARFAGIAAIVRTEHQPLESAPSKVQLVRMKLRDWFLDQVICVSQSTLEYFTRTLSREPDKFTSIPNCLDLRRFDPENADGRGVRKSFGFESESVVVGMVSRLGEARKGAANFLEMAIALSRERPDLRFLVVGDGELRAELERQAAAGGLGDRVAFTGTRRDIPDVLAAMDVFVMPSLWEGGPISVLEAMAMARPVVATRVGMVPEVLTDGENGIIVPPGDTAALINAVRRLVDVRDFARSMGLRARETVLAGFSPDVMVGRVDLLYRSVMARKGSRAASQWMMSR